jgi:acetate kinase
MRVLALNAGSSSLKAAVRDEPGAEPVLRVHVERVTGWADAVASVDAEVDRRAPDPAVVVHRFVHGGPRHHAPTRVDEALLADLREASSLAPLHQPIALAVLSAARDHWPGADHVACFDTDFHAGLPEVARRLPVSAALAAQGIRRYGFHGLSVQAVLTARPLMSDAVVAHLGSGCSVTAVGPDRRSRYTSMSFSPSSGMISSTRSGDLDPEIVLHLIEVHGHSPAALRQELNHGAGLVGVSGGLRDMRELLAAPGAEARLAVDMFVASAAMAIASAATTIDPWHHLVFTGGVGENQPELRQRICERLRLGSGVGVETVPADEERVMDSQARTVVAGGRSTS